VATEHTYTCKPCWKVFQSKETFETHLSSQKHKKTTKGLKPGPESTDAASSEKLSQSEVSSQITEEPKVIETSMDNLWICIFCNNKSEGIKRNLDHMRIKHSFIVLDVDCLISLKAILYYISEKVHVARSCLFCHKNFKDGRSV